MAKVKYKNDYKSLADDCVYLDPQSLISIGGDETFMTTDFRYHGSPVVARAAIGFWRSKPGAVIGSEPTTEIVDLDVIAPGGDLNADAVTITNGPWIEGPIIFPPGGNVNDTAIILQNASELKTKGASKTIDGWSLTSLEDASRPTLIGYSRGGGATLHQSVSYAFTRLSGNFNGTLASEEYQNRFGNTVRQTGEVPTDGAAFETYLGQLGLSADANNGVSGYISSSAYSAGIAPPGGEYTVYTTDFDSPVYSSSSFFSNGDVSFSFRSPCSQLASINAASEINFGYYASFQGPTP